MRIWDIIPKRRIGRTKIVDTMYNINVHNTYYYYYMSDNSTVCYMRCTSITYTLVSRSTSITVHRVLLWFYMGARLKGMWCSTYHIYMRLHLHIIPDSIRPNDFLAIHVPASIYIVCLFCGILETDLHLFTYLYMVIATNIHFVDTVRKQDIAINIYRSVENYFLTESVHRKTAIVCIGERG